MGISIGKCVALLAISLSMTACGSLRLYSDVRDKQGQDAKKAWDAVDFDTTVKTERDNLKKLLAAELDSTAKVQAAIRDNRLRYMVASTLQNGLADQISELHTTLTGTPDASSTLKLYIDTAKPSPDMESLREDMDQLKLGEASCDFALPKKPSPQMAKALTSSDESLKAQAGADYKRLNALCSRSTYSDFEVALKPRGALHQYITERDEAMADLETFKGEANELKATYIAAKKAYDDAAKASPIDKAKKVKDAADKLQAAADALNKSSSPVAQKFIAEVNLEAISDFAKAVAETPTDPSKIPADANKAAVAVVIIPGLMDEATQAANEQRAMRALPLQLRANYEQLRLDAANRDIAAREQVVQLRKDLVKTTINEVLQLSQAYREMNLTAAPAATPKNADTKPVNDSLVGWLAQPVTDLVSKANPNQKQRFYTSAGLYLDALTRLETNRFSILAKINAAMYERALAYAEVNAKQWSSLIGLSVNQVADSASSGIKTDRVVSILNTLGLWWVAHGVNN